MPTYSTGEYLLIIASLVPKELALDISDTKWVINAQPTLSVEQWLEQHGLDCQPESILFIDDKLKNVESAQSCRIDGIHFQGATELLNELTKRQLVL